MFRKQITENFCPLCIAPIIAIAGGGITGVGVMTDEEKSDRNRKFLIWSGISIILSVIIWYIWIRMSGGCRTCTLP